VSAEPIVPASPSTPATIEDMHDAFRRDLKGVREDVVNDLADVRRDLNNGFERQAGSILAVYKLTSERLDAFERKSEQAALELAIVQARRDESEAEFRKAVLGYLAKDRKTVLANPADEANVFRWSFRAIRRVASAFGTDFETTRLALACLVVGLVAMTLTACTMHVSELLK
jgi:hypothetical protein